MVIVKLKKWSCEKAAFLLKCISEWNKNKIYWSLLWGVSVTMTVAAIAMEALQMGVKDICKNIRLHKNNVSTPT